MKNTEKKTPPPYATYKTFLNFINSLKENGTPSHITRSMLPGSNSAKASMSACLKSLGLITKDDIPSESLKQLADPETIYSNKLKEVIYNSYSFLNDPGFDIKNTTTEKVVEKFKVAGASGSTITKGIAFLLAACKDADIEVSRYVKAPQPARSTGVKRKRGVSKINDSQKSQEDSLPETSSEDSHEGMDRITVSLRNMVDGYVCFPANLEKEDAIKAVKAAVFMMKNYYDLKDGDLNM